MTTLLRAAALAAIAFTIHATQTWWLARIQPEISTSLAVRQFDGSHADAQALRWFETEMNSIELGGSALVAIAAVLLFQQPLRRAVAMRPRRRPFAPAAADLRVFPHRLYAVV